MIFFIITYMYTPYEKDIINFQDFTSQKANIKQSLNTSPTPIHKNVLCKL